MATVTRNGIERNVKNLGWLLRNWRSVSGFHVFSDGRGAWLVANLRCGGTYTILFADPVVLRNWLPRPVFAGLPVVWDGVPCVIRRGWYS